MKISESEVFDKGLELFFDALITLIAPPWSGLLKNECFFLEKCVKNFYTLPNYLELKILLPTPYMAEARKQFVSAVRALKCYEKLVTRRWILSLKFLVFAWKPFY